MGGYEDIMNIKLLKNGKVYTPECVGIKDVLIINDKIISISENIPKSSIHTLDKKAKIINASGCIVVPGFIDQHIHINGAGGEGGPQYRTDPVELSKLVKGGITSVVGLLGIDGCARSLRALLMKAKGLEKEGISAWIYTGAYQYPSPTITEGIISDLMLIDKVIGVKIALSDHRSSHPTVGELTKIASDARVGGMMAGKPGIVHIHMGEEKVGLNPLFNIIENTQIPIKQFAPTHLNRNELLFKQAIEFGKRGGYMDLTAGSSNEKKLKASKAVSRLVKTGVSLKNITISTDGNGSMPKFNERKEIISMQIASVDSLYREFFDMVKKEKLPIENAVRVTSTNIAEHLKLEKKGKVKKDKDADLIIFDKDTLRMKYVIAKGKVLMENEQVKVLGTFEKK